MADFWPALVTAIGLVFVIEGAVYSLFPESMKRMMTRAIQSPISRLRSVGLLMALLGVLIVWLVR